MNGSLRVMVSIEIVNGLLLVEVSIATANEWEMARASVVSELGFEVRELLMETALEEASCPHHHETFVELA